MNDSLRSESINAMGMVGTDSVNIFLKFDDIGTKNQHLLEKLLLPVFVC